MPTISAPVMGEGIYMPGATFGGFLNSRAEEKKSADENNSAEKKELSDEQKTKIMLGSLTANDISVLDGMGLFDGIASPNAWKKFSESDTKEILNDVLLRMEEIKEKENDRMKKSPQKNQAAQSSVRKTDDAKKNPKVLRFSVNGYDILKTCKKIYISNMKDDGTFLVTGDRQYSSDGKIRGETFHILFKNTTKSEDGNYSAAAAVTQDYLNEYSFLYQLSLHKDLTASRIGNFVTMRIQEDDWKLELLIDLGDV